ncbi:angiopoietin-2-like isoform X1 [Lingula anatina]|uniref:Angiopoietin-2-like isoform X1 n=1 Tax=Lingula anatina TaxID=7574 RepID=A0A1S3I3B4_LINAN|nr:angiopoietin-2-like isoform X1 [Lingula anatina]|eukprot:XP_013392760.1 angiopoietin-2-like isoform X1 [Lingula anatina]
MGIDNIEKVYKTHSFDIVVGWHLYKSSRQQSSGVDFIPRQKMLFKIFLFTFLELFTTQQNVKYAFFDGTKDAILPSSTMKKVTAESTISCALQCSQTKECRSWNYYKTRNIENCVLNSLKALNSDILVRHDGGIYYQDDKDEMDCNDIDGAGMLPIKIAGFGTKEVYCDNGWLVLMRRYDNSMKFNRSWNEYKIGFGDPRLQFWMGNEALYALTNQGDYSMLVDMLSCNGNYYYVKWNVFRIKNETMKYAVDALNLESYNTTSTTGLLEIRGRPFGTTDDTSAYSGYLNETCAERHGGGWWFSWCTNFHLTGNYLDCNNTGNIPNMQKKMKCVATTGINCDLGCVLQAATMKLRRKN